MSKVLPIFLIFGSFLISASVLTRFNIGAMFDVKLVVIVCYGLTKGEYKGAIFGFFTGLVFGILLANMVGFFALLGFVTGYASGIFFKYDSERSLIVTVLIILGIVFAYQTVAYIGQAVFLGQPGLMQRLHMIVFPKTILTTALFVPVYLLVNRFRNKVKRVEFV